jgi:hypothetical protein
MLRKRRAALMSAFKGQGRVFPSRTPCVRAPVLDVFVQGRRRDRWTSVDLL